MSEAFIVGGVRSPFGRFGGSLSDIRADDLAAFTIKHLLNKYPQIPSATFDDVILGCANQAGEDNRNIARMSALLAGLPVSVPGETVNRLCASGMSAIVQAQRAISSRQANLIIAGGVEHMTRGPFVLSKSSMPFGRDVKLYDTSFGWRFINPKMKNLYGTHAMGETAEQVAIQFNINRDDQDLFAYRSQIKASKAQKNGRLSKEIVPIEIPQKKKDPIVFSEDEFIKPQTTVEILSSLRTAFSQDEKATVTAGNSSGLNDGSVATIIASENTVNTYNLTPLARVVTAAVVGVEPRIMGMGPVEASQKALKQAKVELSDIDVIEINEAFAAQSLACIRELGLEDDDPRINPNGGAIAIGHPLGASGSRILLSAAIELQRTQKQYALATMCVGVGQGYATIIERV